MCYLLRLDTSSPTNQTIVLKRMYGIDLAGSIFVYKCRICVQISFDAETFKQKYSMAVVEDVGLLVDMKVDNETELKWSKPVAYITSQPNSFGALTRQWYDGHARKTEIGWGIRKRVYITSIKETLFMNGTCSDKSYYQSLVEVFLRKNFQMEGCPIRYECLAQTLAFDVPVCPEKYGSNETLGLCYGKAMMTTKRDFQSSSKKSCNNKEYNIEERFSFYPISNNAFSLSVRFKNPSKKPSQQNVWTSQVVKTVSTEFYIENWVGLFGTIGGTLGIFVGITLLDILGWVRRTLKVLVISSQSGQKNWKRKKGGERYA